MQKLISIVIVTYNSENDIYDCLDSIYKYNDIGDLLEIIIVDNCSLRYSTMATIINEKYNEEIVLISNERNGGYGQGNNIGIKAARSPYIMIMNPDVRFVMPCLSTICTFMQNNDRVALYGMKQLDYRKKRGISFACNSFIMPYISIPLSSICNKLELYLHKYMYIAGACFVIQKEAFQKAGLFDENIFMYHEEEDIHQRIRDNNYHIEYNKKICYQHCHIYKRVMSKDDYIKKMLLDLESLIYLGSLKNISEVKIIRNEIKKSNIFIVRAVILSFFKGKPTNLIEWNRFLKNKLKTIQH